LFSGQGEQARLGTAVRSGFLFRIPEITNIKEFSFFEFPVFQVSLQKKGLGDGQNLFRGMSFKKMLLVSSSNTVANPQGLVATVRAAESACSPAHSAQGFLTINLIIPVYNWINFKKDL
jgi:hypothetical protein